jgi:hypothetical protein
MSELEASYSFGSVWGKLKERYSGRDGNRPEGTTGLVYASFLACSIYENWSLFLFNLNCDCIGDDKQHFFPNTVTVEVDIITGGKIF